MGPPRGPPGVWFKFRGPTAISAPVPWRTAFGVKWAPLATTASATTARKQGNKAGKQGGNKSATSRHRWYPRGARGVGQIAAGGGTLSLTHAPLRPSPSSRRGGPGRARGPADRRSPLLCSRACLAARRGYLCPDAAVDMSADRLPGAHRSAAACPASVHPPAVRLQVIRPLPDPKRLCLRRDRRFPPHFWKFHGTIAHP